MNPNEIKHFAENEFKIDGVILYDNDFMVYANTLAEECNKNFGTAYSVDQDAIKRNRHQVFGNNHTPERMQIRKTWGGKYELLTIYHYEDANLRGCVATWGAYTQDELTDLCDKMLAYIPTMKQVSREKTLERYDFYDRIGIRYAERPDYFDTL